MAVAAHIDQHDRGQPHVGEFLERRAVAVRFEPAPREIILHIQQRKTGFGDHLLVAVAEHVLENVLLADGDIVIIGQQGRQRCRTAGKVVLLREGGFVLFLLKALDIHREAGAADSDIFEQQRPGSGRDSGHCRCRETERSRSRAKLPVPCRHAALCFSEVALFRSPAQCTVIKIDVLC
jgi:hypothetical protein